MKPIVVNQFQLARLNGKFIKETDKGEQMRKNIVLDENYVKEYNENWENSGKIYVEDKEATKKYEQYQQEVIEERKKQEQLRNAGAEAIASVIMKHNDKIVDQGKSTLDKVIYAGKNLVDKFKGGEQ